MAHQAIPRALELAGREVGAIARWEWLSTPGLEDGAAARLKRFDAAWCVPGSPYKSEPGAIAGIRFARESGMPFLGTCGGCQHAILEYARNVLGYANAEHSETRPDAELPLIAPLSCALVDVEGPITLDEGSVLRRIYGRTSIQEGYHCRFGLNPRLEHLLQGSELRITGRDANGEARAFEMPGGRFFVLTQFQPERAALKGRPPHVVMAFIQAAAAPRPSS